ncbi:hypothetical protein DF19_00095 [Streptomyces olindensis]|nr:hypothetical protein DF19_00095 [Streptomyces olindensis]
MTSVGPPAVSFTRLPSTVTEPGRSVVATGFLPTSQVAVEMTCSISISDSSGRLGTCRRAWAGVALPSAFVAVVVAVARATSPVACAGLAPARTTGPTSPQRGEIAAVFESPGTGVPRRHPHGYPTTRPLSTTRRGAASTRTSARGSSS